MSGPLRQIIGPTKSRLKDQTKEGQNLLKATDRSQTFVSKARAIIFKINRSIGILEAQNEKWSELIIYEQGDALQKEYDQFVSVADNFIAIIQQGREISDDLEIALINISAPEERSKVRWPQLTLPTFGGSILEWPNFWACFESAVHDKPNIEDIEKLNYLKGCLKGNVEREILPHYKPDNYQIVVDFLTKKYGDDKTIKMALYGELKRIQPMGNRTPDLRKAQS
jgi:hypothetical protein